MASKNVPTEKWAQQRMNVFQLSEPRVPPPIVSSLKGILLFWLLYCLIRQLQIVCYKVALFRSSWPKTRQSVECLGRSGSCKLLGSPLALRMAFPLHALGPLAAGKPKKSCQKVRWGQQKMFDNRPCNSAYLTITVPDSCQLCYVCCIMASLVCLQCNICWFVAMHMDLCSSFSG